MMPVKTCIHRQPETTRYISSSLQAEATYQNCNAIGASGGQASLAQLHRGARGGQREAASASRGPAHNVHGCVLLFGPLTGVSSLKTAPGRRWPRAGVERESRDPRLMRFYFAKLAFTIFTDLPRFCRPPPLPPAPEEVAAAPEVLPPPGLLRFPPAFIDMAIP